MANILIVHAHHEPQSFSTALAAAAIETLAAQGHEIVFSDLYAMAFDPVSDRRNFTTCADSGYLKQQREETYATEHSGFVPELEAEMRKVEACDLMIFSFPLWWFGLPALLKGWVDRVFAHGRMYRRGHLYENGPGRGKRAMVVMTTGSGAEMYGGKGMHPPLDSVLAPVNHGVFWFNGFSPLSPFVAWSAAHGTDEDRRVVLDGWRARLEGIFEEEPLKLPNASDFAPETSADTFSRFMVTLRRISPVDGKYRELLPAQAAQLETLRRSGRILSIYAMAWDAADWQGFLLFRERTETEVAAACRDLIVGKYLGFEIARVA